ncbi:hypothetical protein FH5T_16245 [Draconibacterium orientale]|uniref:Fibrobacter succinogenes major paralogous domain-containing protein n=1 Tax=Draconibacterium orientale TaxID=1168034 RepID=A0ABM5QEA3_9BACT|nr:fibrobacter succinogenes major paralogous domain-containing protein [Draconibacterium orientale]AHW62154.1 hypothetical protein FH5T_16245 [Draconibacterium orientale]
MLGCSDDSTNPEEQDVFSGDSGTFIDERDGHEYKWVKIGEQIWMAENLKYLPFTYFTREDQPLTAAYFVYDYFGASVEEAKATDNFEKYGVLYNYMATLEACPEGWHVPSDNEWEQLAEYISSQNEDYYKYESAYDESGTADDWKEVGKHLKSNNGWELPSGYSDIESNGIDEFGFTALPAGHYIPDNNHDFLGVGTSTEFWSSTQGQSEGIVVRTGVFARTLSSYRPDFERRLVGVSGTSLSIRCIKD